MVATDMASQRLVACALQEVALEGEERRQVGDYVFYARGAWRPEVVQGHNKGGRHKLVGGAAVGIHVSLEASVIRTVHRAGRVQLVMLRGARGKRLVFGSLYAPTERSSDAAKEKDKDKEKEKFWSDVMAALEENGLKERDVLVLAADINGETGRQVRDDAEEDEVDAV
jgi:hypothetical protein